MDAHRWVSPNLKSTRCHSSLQPLASPPPLPHTVNSSRLVRLPKHSKGCDEGRDNCVSSSTFGPQPGAVSGLFKRDQNQIDQLRTLVRDMQLQEGSSTALEASDGCTTTSIHRKSGRGIWRHSGFAERSSRQNSNARQLNTSKFPHAAMSEGHYERQHAGPPHLC